ncbi:MAG: hypothetical protein AB1454_00015 [Candidatus Auribacterota bacterium]
MGTAKLRIVFHSDKDGNALSYFYLEKTEGLRVIAILKILPKLKDWTPISKIAEMIDSKLPATLWTVQKLAGAERVDIKLDDGKVKVLAHKPILLVRKRKFNTRNNLKRQKYLRATVYVKFT